MAVLNAGSNIICITSSGKREIYDKKGPHGALSIDSLYHRVKGDRPIQAAFYSSEEEVRDINEITE